MQTVWVPPRNSGIRYHIELGGKRLYCGIDYDEEIGWQPMPEEYALGQRLKLCQHCGSLYQEEMDSIQRITSLGR